MAPTLGVALPHYDASTPGPGTAEPAELAAAARTAERLGFTTGWVSDHFVLPRERYGLPVGETGSLECWTAMTIAAAATSTLRVGSLVLCEAFRNPGLLAKMAVTFDALSRGRLELGLGAGWHEVEYTRAGYDFRAPGVRLARLDEALQIVRGMLTEPPYTFRGEHHAAVAAACAPPPVQRPTPPIWVGGSGDRLLDLVARRADGWNFGWRVETSWYRSRLAVLAAACERAGRDPASVRKSLGFYCVVGADDAEVRASLARLGVSDVAYYSEGALIGTVAAVRDRLAELGELGVEHVVLTPGPMPFSWPGDWWPESVTALL